MLHYFIPSFPWIAPGWRVPCIAPGWRGGGHLATLWTTGRMLAGGQPIVPGLRASARPTSGAGSAPLATLLWGRKREGLFRFREREREWVEKRLYKKLMYHGSQSSGLPKHCGFELGFEVLTCFLQNWAKRNRVKAMLSSSETTSSIFTNLIDTYM